MSKANLRLSEDDPGLELLERLTTDLEMCFKINFRHAYEAGYNKALSDLKIQKLALEKFLSEQNAGVQVE